MFLCKTIVWFCKHPQPNSDSSIQVLDLQDYKGVCKPTTWPFWCRTEGENAQNTHTLWLSAVTGGGFRDVSVTCTCTLYMLSFENPQNRTRKLVKELKKKSPPPEQFSQNPWSVLICCYCNSWINRLTQKNIRWSIQITTRRNEFLLEYLIRRDTLF